MDLCYLLIFVTVYLVFQIETRVGVTHTFVSIERDEYNKLYDFVMEKRLRVKNIDSKHDADASKLLDNWSSSDEEHDAYLDKVKAEGRERLADSSKLGGAGGGGTFAGANFSDDDDEEDEDFAPPPSGSSESDIAEEYDSNAAPSDSDADYDANADNRRGGSSSSESASDSGSERRVVKEKPKKPRKEPTEPSKPRKQKKAKAPVDPNKPQRPASAYFLWMQDNRSRIKSELGSGAGVTDVAKASGEQWKNLDPVEKEKYQRQGQKLKEEYEEKMREYKASGGGETSSKPSSSSAGTTKKKPAASTNAGSGSAGFKSSEFVESSSSEVESGGDAAGGAESDSDSD